MLQVTDRTHSTGPASITALFEYGCAPPPGRLILRRVRRKE
ncbi:hypothetical protein SSAG_02340 [Streptomyces sp. Mg1]|nr:hypothetical protein SSAG_02340 [Streptomyces sp. Mg1]